MQKTLSVTFCGVIAALCTAMMLLSSLIDVATLALPALAGIFLIAVVTELGEKWAWCVYAVVSLLSFFLVAAKDAVAIFVLFFGYYPILKLPLERIKKRWLSWTAKLLIFNAAAIADYFICIYLFMIPQENIFGLGIYAPLLLLLLGNVAFFLYDYALTGVGILYYRRIHQKIGKYLHK